VEVGEGPAEGAAPVIGKVARPLRPKRPRNVLGAYHDAPNAEAWLRGQAMVATTAGGYSAGRHPSNRLCRAWSCRANGARCSTRSTRRASSVGIEPVRGSRRGLPSSARMCRLQGSPAQ